MISKLIAKGACSVLMLQMEYSSGEASILFCGWLVTQVFLEKDLGIGIRGFECLPGGEYGQTLCPPPQDCFAWASTLGLGDILGLL